DFRAAEMLEDLRTGVGRVATVEDASRGQVANRIRPWRPPLRALGALLIELEHAVRLAPARIVGDAAAGNDRPSSVVHDSAGFVLIHAQMDVVPCKVSGLRDAADHFLADRARDR